MLPRAKRLAQIVLLAATLVHTEVHAAQASLICRAQSFLQSFDVGGIYFRALPAGVCESIRPSDIEFRVQPPGSSLKTPHSLITPEDDMEHVRKFFDPNLPTAVYVHGFFEGAKASSVRAFRSAYLRLGGHNLLLVNWQQLANAPWYPSAVRNFPLVGRRLGKMLVRLLDDGAIRLEGLHLLGFSLGAHVCAVAARHLTRGRRVPRITALDPAYPLITKLPPALRLDKSSANFVDVIHTCGGLYGLYLPTGHVDFYPNGGTSLQPGCIINLAPITCSHWRSWRFFVESLQGGEFVATACASWSDFERGRCTSNRKLLMGIHVDTTARGVFYLRTSWHPPFALSLAEAHPETL